MYKQVRSFHQAQAGNKAGYCLADTRAGFGIPAKYPCAWAAWQHTQQHTDAIPADVDVPLFFSYQGDTNGHVGVRLASGQFWSEGSVYSSLQAWQKNHMPQYVGWGESLNDFPVLVYSADPAPQPASNTLNFDQSIHLPADSGIWHLYHYGGPYQVAAGQWITILHPSSTPNGYTYPAHDLGNGLYAIKSPQWGIGVLYTNGSKFSVN